MTKNIPYYYSKFMRDFEKTVKSESKKLNPATDTEKDISNFLEKIIEVIKKYPKDVMIEILFTVHQDDELLYLIARSRKIYKEISEKNILVNLLEIVANILDMPLSEAENILTNILKEKGISKIPVPIKHDPKNAIFATNNLEVKEILEYYKNFELLE